MRGDELINQLVNSTRSMKKFDFEDAAEGDDGEDLQEVEVMDAKQARLNYKKKQL